MILSGKVFCEMGTKGIYSMAMLQVKPYGTFIVGAEKKNRVLVNKLKSKNNLTFQGEITDYTEVSKHEITFNIIDKKLGKVYFFTSKKTYNLLLESKELEKIRNPPSLNKKNKILHSFLKNKKGR